jgi:DNA-binding transcriptional LysR family regulator
MELRHLRYFVTLADELHFGRAAVRLGISQPPLSQQIKALEDGLGARLFERTNRRVALTQAGRMFLGEARATLAQADRAAQVARRAQRGELGELRIGMFPSAPLIPIIGRSILAFRRGYPDVQLTLSEFESRQQMQALAEGREHIAIVRGAASPTVPTELLASELLRERLVVVMPADHALARRPGKLAMAALANEAFVFYGSRMGTTLPTQVLGLCRAAGFEPRISQVASANATILGLVAVGLGIAIVPEAMSLLRHDAVVTRAIAAPDAMTSVWILRRRAERSPLIDAFIGLAMGGLGSRPTRHRRDARAA